MRAPVTFALVFIFASLAFSSCHRPAEDAPVSAPQPVDDREEVLKKLHRAAEEMALDGFQFNRPELGWPHDIGATTSAAFLSKLQSSNSSAPLPPIANVAVANVAETDPLGTALFKIRSHDGHETVIRKDGQLAPASPPPRDPQWLP